jgi:hypothetical protein
MYRSRANQMYDPLKERDKTIRKKKEKRPFFKNGFVFRTGALCWLGCRALLVKKWKSWEIISSK